MTSMNEQSMGIVGDPAKPIPCGEYQPKNEKGEFMPLPEFVAIVCPFCFFAVMYGVKLPECEVCGNERAVLKDKSKLKVIS